MATKETAYKFISELVERFEDQKEYYKRSDYNETLTRKDYIDPFFEALGWDMNNKQGVWEAYREVIHEDKLKISGVTKAPDYSFRLMGGQRLFFVEAKKPSIVVKDDLAPAFQVRLYGWNAKLPLSIVTDFEEFAIYDCSKKPGRTDKASTGRVNYFTYKDYLSHFDFFWNTFSREQVVKGGLVKFQRSEKKGTATVDKAFLESLDEWRKLLAANIYKNNPEITEEELNYTVQQNIDRIIFLRIAEDRALEPYGQLKSCLQSENNYGELYRQFRVADDKYNSGLFHFRKEKENDERPDTISGKLHIDNKIIKSIIGSLYPPQSDYLFNVLPVEILGSAYEQFLGKQITIKGSKAIIEEKPEVRKAGGVYYTPQYIVDYIVEKTVGKLCEGKTVKEISKLKIVDPACGSGSFLLGAYQYLLNKHLELYKVEVPGKKKNSVLTPEGNLTTAEKKRILLNNIYGVDIDANAVEVTKLSLLLKCMEGETAASVNTQMTFFNERVLPSLEKNIKCGNSLIDLDFYDGELDFEPGTEKKIKPFNWQQGFPEIFKQGGFDAVIGNPPYVRQEMLGEQKPYFQKHYSVYHGMADLYSYFIEKGIHILKETGLFGIIVANKWMRANYGQPLRHWLKHQILHEIIDFDDLQVFKGATTYPCIIIASPIRDVSKLKTHCVDIAKIRTLDFDSLGNYVKQEGKKIYFDSLEVTGWHLGGEDEQQLLKKLEKVGKPLEEFVKGKIFRGVLTGLNEAFVIDKATKDKLVSQDSKSEEIIKPFLTGRDIKRYQQPQSDKFLIFTRRGINIDEYPAVKKYLARFKDQLLPKPSDWKEGEWNGRKPGAYKWYEIQDAVDYYIAFEEKKIIYPNICKQPEFTFDDNGWFTNQKCFIIALDDKYLLGILNSKLNFYLFKQYLPKLRGDFYEPSYVFFKNFPIKAINQKEKKEVDIQKDIAKLSEIMLNLNKAKLETTSIEKLDELQKRIEYTDSKINKLVYELYGLTEEEINIVEGAIK